MVLFKQNNKKTKKIGFKKLLLNKGYDGEISMLLAPLTNQPTTGPPCVEHCKSCSTKSNEMTVIKSSTQNAASDCTYENNNEQNNSQDSNQLTSSIYIDMTAKKPLAKSTEPNSMKIVNGKFFMVNGANISCACPRSPNGFSKYCHLCDGYIDLILVRHTTFFNNIRFLLAMSSRNCKIVCSLLLMGRVLIEINGLILFV